MGKRNNRSLPEARGSFVCILVCAMALSSCYLSNTPPRPNAAGFHNAAGFYDVSGGYHKGLSPFDTAREKITGMAYGLDTVVAVSYQGNIAYSKDDGVNWRVAGDISGISENINFNAIAFGGGVFFAGGDSGKAAYSFDGIHWKTGVIAPMFPTDIYGVAVGTVSNRQVFAAVGAAGWISYAIGSPGSWKWQRASLSPFGSAERIRAVAYGSVKGTGVFIAAGDDGKVAFTSNLDGLWYGGRTGSSRDFYSVCYGNEKFIAVGGTGRVSFSPDPRTYKWTQGNGGIFGVRSLLGISFDPLVEQFVAFGEESVVAYSEFGDSWEAATFRSRFPAGISALVCTKSRIILGGSDGAILYSN
jgi:hypothetical protein